MSLFMYTYTQYTQTTKWAVTDDCAVVEVEVVGGGIRHLYGDRWKKVFSTRNCNNSGLRTYHATIYDMFL